MVVVLFALGAWTHGIYWPGNSGVGCCFVTLVFLGRGAVGSLHLGLPLEDLELLVCSLS